MVIMEMLLKASLYNILVDMKLRGNRDYLD
jgi:hypothetical protein